MYVGRPGLSFGTAKVTLNQYYPSTTISIDTFADGANLVYPQHLTNKQRGELRRNVLFILQTSERNTSLTASLSIITREITTGCEFLSRLEFILLSSCWVPPSYLQFPSRSKWSCPPRFSQGLLILSRESTQFHTDGLDAIALLEHKRFTFKLE